MAFTWCLEPPAFRKSDPVSPLPGGGVYDQGAIRQSSESPDFTEDEWEEFIEVVESELE